MKKTVLRFVSTFIMISICLVLTGCQAIDSVMQAAEYFLAGVSLESLEVAENTEETNDGKEAENADGNTAATSEEAMPDTEQDISGTSEEHKKAVPDIPGFTDELAGHYAYDSLTETEQIWYRDMVDTLGRMLEKQELSAGGLEAGLDESDIDKIFQCVLNDHPEYFYVEGYTYTKYSRQDQLVKLEFTGTYSMTRDEAIKRSLEIKAAAGEMINGISQDADEYEKVKYIYEILIRNTEYDLTAPDNQNIYSVFVNQASVCQGYAKAAQYLLNHLGIESTIVMGIVNNGEGHAWNLVKVDGGYYYMDATWGDASYQLEDVAEAEMAGYLPEINYDYLCVTTAQITQTHQVGSIVPMPLCTSLEANYYVREGLYFNNFDLEHLRQVFTDAAGQNKTDITLKCADAAVYTQMSKSLIEDQKIFDYLEAPEGTIAYAQNEKQLSLTFWMP